MRRASGTLKDPIVVISADAKATHQAVVRVMEASRVAGLSRSPLPPRQPGSHQLSRAALEPAAAR
jgi:biopolymer transport protein ExbD